MNCNLTLFNIDTDNLHKVLFYIDNYVIYKIIYLNFYVYKWKKIINNNYELLDFRIFIRQILKKYIIISNNTIIIQHFYKYYKILLENDIYFNIIPHKYYRKNIFIFLYKKTNNDCALKIMDFL